MDERALNRFPSKARRKVSSQPYYTNEKQRDSIKPSLCFWQGQKGSNPRPTVLETGTLPTELYPCISPRFPRDRYIISHAKQNFNTFLKKTFSFQKILLHRLLFVEKQGVLAIDFSKKHSCLLTNRIYMI